MGRHLAELARGFTVWTAGVSSPRWKSLFGLLNVAVLGLIVVWRRRKALRTDAACMTDDNSSVAEASVESPPRSPRKLNDGTLGRGGNEVVGALPEDYCCKSLSRRTTAASSSEEDGEDTLYRQWLCSNAEPEQVDTDEPVIGLRAALREAGLSDYTDTCEAWCLEEGAAFLDELLENLDEFIDGIFLSDSFAAKALTRADVHTKLEGALLASSYRGATHVNYSGGGISSVGCCLDKRLIVHSSLYMTPRSAGIP